MTNLSQISKEVAVRLLEEVSFENHIEGSRMTPMNGALRTMIFSFEEAVKFLQVGFLEEIYVGGSRAFVGYLDLHELKNWIGEVYGDKELADAIEQEIDKGNNYMERIDPVRELMKQRLSQCKHILEKNEL